MKEPRPYGFRDFVRVRGYCSLYLLSADEEAGPIKVGITNDPVRRLDDFQTAHYRTLEFHRVWWMAGQPVASRLENAFKLYFFPEHIRGEWYDIDLAEAVAFVEETLVTMRTWGVTQEDIEMKMMRGVVDRFETSIEVPRDAAEAKARGLRTLQGRSRRF